MGKVQASVEMVLQICWIDVIIINDYSMEAPIEMVQLHTERLTIEMISALQHNVCQFAWFGLLRGITLSASLAGTATI